MDIIVLKYWKFCKKKEKYPWWWVYRYSQKYSFKLFIWINFKRWKYFQLFLAFYANMKDVLFISWINIAKENTSINDTNVKNPYNVRKLAWSLKTVIEEKFLYFCKWRKRSCISTEWNSEFYK